MSALRVVRLAGRAGRAQAQRFDPGVRRDACRCDDAHRERGVQRAAAAGFAKARARREKACRHARRQRDLHAQRQAGLPAVVAPHAVAVGARDQLDAVPGVDLDNGLGTGLALAPGAAQAGARAGGRPVVGAVGDRHAAGGRQQRQRKGAAQQVATQPQGRGRGSCHAQAQARTVAGRPSERSRSRR